MSDSGSSTPSQFYGKERLDAEEFLKKHQWDQQEYTSIIRMEDKVYEMQPEGSPDDDEDEFKEPEDDSTQISIQVPWMLTPQRDMVQILKDHHLNSDEFIEGFKTFANNPEVDAVDPNIMEKIRVISNSSALSSALSNELMSAAYKNAYVLIGTISGFAAALVSATGTKHIEMMKDFAKLLDHQAAREVQMMEDHKLLGEEMRRYATQINISSGLTATLTASVHDLELLVNDLR